ncbi:MAG: class I SAM-dependent rRNA methyltransferase [Saprospiraceae bacterium]|nr:class I SAM-dependent rRNA methyltransferase [Saprospiraceae bacterium]
MKDTYPIITIRKGKEEAISRRHPWIFSGAIYSKPSDLTDGQVVRVVDFKGKHLATGHYHDGSIMVRILSFKDVAIDQGFWNRTMKSAYAYRKSLGLIENSETNAFRFIHGEGDGVSGLIIDIYNNNAVIQCHSVGCYRDVKYISTALDYAFGGGLDCIYIKSKDSLPSSFDGHEEDYYIKGNPSSTEIVENGIKFAINWEEGQKTGFFLDQRENRHKLAQFSEGKTVLNCFCYTGGFSIYALANGASSVHSIDVSKSAMEMVAKNHKINEFGDNHVMDDANVMHLLGDEKLQKFDVVVIDPPAFAKSVKKRHNAVQAYKRLNIMALKKVKHKGHLFTFSCSQVVGPELFYNTIRSAAIESGRKIRIVHHLSQGPDHPINIYHPEGNYLKGLVLYVE